MNIPLGPHMLPRGEVGNDVERAVRLEELLEELASEVNRFGDILLRHVVVASPKLARQFRKRVLVDVDYKHRTRLESAQRRLNVVATDRPRAADDKHPLAVDPRMHLISELLEIRLQERLLTPCHVLSHKLFNIKINHAILLLCAPTAHSQYLLPLQSQLHHKYIRPWESPQQTTRKEHNAAPPQNRLEASGALSSLPLFELHFL